MRSISLAIILGFVAACGVAPAATPAPAARASATPSPQALAYARALDWFHRLQSGNVDRSQLTQTFSAQLTSASIEQTKEQLRVLGEPTAFVPEPGDDRFGVDAYVYDLTFKNGITYAYYFVVDDAGKIAGIRLIAKSGP